MEKYSQAGMQAGLDKIRFGGGNSPLGAAIAAAAADLEKTSGSAVLVIVSDGIQNNMDDAVTAAQKAKAAMGDRLCIYTVQVGTDASGAKVLEKVVAAGGCGSADNAAALTSAAAMGAFVEKVFLTAKPAPAPVAAPAPAPVPAPAPAPAPAPVVKEIITFNLLFDFDKATIRDDMVPMLEQAQKILNEDPAATYVIAGHTCSIGTDAYNQKLSERRAAAVKNWLVSNGIAGERLETVGYGETQPKYDNKTDEGRTLNRRVEIQSK
jgi:OmpA-OmpF porin, OOP family